jgi:hypothetical protein
MPEISDADLGDLKKLLADLQDRVGKLTVQNLKLRSDLDLANKLVTLYEDALDKIANGEAPPNVAPPTLSAAEQAKLQAEIAKVNTNTATWSNLCTGLQVTALKSIRTVFTGLI